MDIEIPEGNLIVPGVSIGAVKIGDSLERVRELYGKPTWEGDFDLFNRNPWLWANLSSFDWYNSRNQPIQISYLDLGLFVWLNNQTSLVEYIGVMPPNDARTSSGNGIESAFANVTQEFGEADETDKTVIDKEVMNSYDAGIAFWYGTGLKVTRIIIH